MNRLINSAFQIAQRGPSFNVVKSGVYTLDRWVSISDEHSRINIKQRKSPSAVEIEFNSAGYGGIVQVLEHDQVMADYGRALCFSVNAKSEGSMIINAQIFLLGWRGAIDKPEIGFFPFSPDWVIIAAKDIDFIDNNRCELFGPHIPEFNNIAVAIVADADSGSKLIIRDVSLSESGEYIGYNYSDELRRCSWFYQHYDYSILMNTEWGVGRADPGGFVSFQFPMSYPLRGKLGGIGADAIKVDWPVASAGYWHYGNGGVCMFSAKPTLTCHHRRFLLFTTPGIGTIPAQSTTIFRHWQMQPNAYITIDAELRS